MKLDLDYDKKFETTVTGTFRTYQAESIGLSFAVQQAEARAYKPDPDNAQAPWVIDPDINTWGAAARVVNNWTLFKSRAASAGNLYPGAPASYRLKYNITKTSHTISSMLFGTNIEHFDTEDRYWADYGESSELIRLMKERPVSWIRFPGGEPTSFYHFNSNNKKITTTARWGVDEWDTSKSNAQRALAADSDFVGFDEFAKIVKHTGATPFIGVNLESAYYFRALEADRKLLDPANAAEIKKLLEREDTVCEIGQIPAVATAKSNFLTNYSSGSIQDGLDQAGAVARYMDELNLGVRHWYLDNESDLPTYYPELSATFAMQYDHYARMARDYISVIDQATSRTDNEYILSWYNVGLMRDIGWDRILDDIGSLVDYLDFHTYWWVHGGSWSLNLASLPHASFPSFGVSSWDLWKEELPMRWENFDDEGSNFCTGKATKVFMSPAPAGPVSLAQYFRLARKALDDGGHAHLKIMLGEWGVAPRGHWRLDPTRYQVTVMLAEYFMQMISSGAIDAAASWPFSSRGGPFLDHRHNVLHKPDGTNEIIASYEMQKLFKPFIGARYMPVSAELAGKPALSFTDSTFRTDAGLSNSDLVTIGAYHAGNPSLHVALLNKSGEEKNLCLSSGSSFDTAQISRMQPADDAGEYDDTYGSGAPVFTTGKATRLENNPSGAASPEVCLTMKPWSLAWVNFSASRGGK